MARSKKNQQTGKTVLEKRRVKREKQATTVKQRKRADALSSS